VALSVKLIMKKMSNLMQIITT